MRKKENDSFIKHLREYFTIYLPKQRNGSQHTIDSSILIWNLLLRYISNEKNISIQNITFNVLNCELIKDFLNKLEAERNWCSNTYNQRLACIRSFFQYVSRVEPILGIYYESLKGIPLKKGVDKSYIVDYMTKESVRALLEQPDISIKSGIRDQFFMSLMYDSAARDSELLGMKLVDFDVNKKTVYLNGKGSKPRVVPITQETVNLFNRYKGIFHTENDMDSPLFYTIHRKQKTIMSDDNVARFMKKYANEARIKCSEIPQNVHPHMLRHSRAMHLYQAGMSLSIIAEWLGHNNPETSLIYAYANTEMKREAIQKATVNDNVLNTSQLQGKWVGNDDIIKKLCGLG